MTSSRSGPTGRQSPIWVSCHLWAACLLSFLACLPSARAADGAASDHPVISATELKDFVKASRSLEERLNRLGKGITALEGNPSQENLNKARIYSDCWEFAHVVLYAQFANVVDNIDTAPFYDSSDFRENRYDDRILSDPRQIAIELRDRISGLQYDKQYHDPLHDFAIEKSHDDRLRALCHAYINSH